MPSAVKLREDYSAEALRGLARRTGDVNQNRWLLSSDQCQPVHTKNPQHGSPDSGPVAAQPAREPIATASSAMNNHRPISEHPIRDPSPAARSACSVA